jgi:hypothetical protein
MLTKFGDSPHILLKVPNLRFNRNPSGRAALKHVDRLGDGQTDMMKLTGAFWDYANVRNKNPLNGWRADTNTKVSNDFPPFTLWNLVHGFNANRECIRTGFVSHRPPFNISVDPLSSRLAFTTIRSICLLNCFSGVNFSGYQIHWPQKSHSCNCFFLTLP